MKGVVLKLAFVLFLVLQIPNFNSQIFDSHYLLSRRTQGVSEYILSAKFLTTEEFNQKYGWVVEPTEDGRDEGLNYFSVLTSQEERVGSRVATLVVREQGITRLERHPDTYEYFGVLSGRCVLFLAPPGDSPNPDEIEAVILDVDRPLLLKEGVWHGIVSLTAESRVVIFESSDVESEYFDLEGVFKTSLGIEYGIKKATDYLEAEAETIVFSKHPDYGYGVIDVNNIAEPGLSPELVAEALRSPSLASDIVSGEIGVIEIALGNAIATDTSIVENLIRNNLNVFLASMDVAATDEEISSAVDKFIKEEKYREYEFINIIESDENDLPVLNGDGTPKILENIAQYDTFLHIEGNWHPTAHVMVIDKNGNVLIQVRKNGQRDISASGHLAVGETLEDGAIRELQEEVLDLDLHRDLVRIGSFIKIGGGYNLKGKVEESFDAGTRIYYGPSSTVYNKEVSTLYVYCVDEIRKDNDGNIIVEVDGKVSYPKPNINEKIMELIMMPVSELGQAIDDDVTANKIYRGTPRQYFHPAVVWREVRAALIKAGFAADILPESWANQIQ
ncbi:MAG: NUDIX domain-containing protein [Candidatus Kaelpia imicola]|nr:NUDIX domain-containing protein [Candidatus Kaelpia imicola]